MMRKSVKTILIVFTCLGFGVSSYSLTIAGKELKISDPNGTLFTAEELEDMYNEAHVLRIIHNYFYTAREPSINKEFPEILGELREMPRRFVLPVAAHDSEKLIPKFRKFLIENFNVDFKKLPPIEQEKKYQEINEMNEAGKLKWEEQMTKAGFMKNHKITELGVKQKAVEMFNDGEDVPNFRNDVGPNAEDFYNFINKYPNRFKNVEYLEPMKNLAKFSSEDPDFNNNIKTNAEWLSSEEYIANRAKSYKTVPFSKIQDEFNKIQIDYHEEYLAAEKMQKPLPDPMMGKSKIAELQKTIVVTSSEAVVTGALDLIDKTKSIVGAFGEVLILKNVAQAWRKLNNPRYETVTDSLSDFFRFGSKSKISKCEKIDQLKSEKIASNTKQFDVLSKLINNDKCLIDKYMNVKAMQCNPEAGAKVHTDSAHSISLRSKSPERSEYNSIVELKQNKIQSVTLKKISDKEVKNDFALQDSTSISITTDNNSAFTICIKAPLLTHVNEADRWISKSTCAQMKDINDVSVLKRLDKTILSHLSIDFFSELQRVTNTFTDYSSEAVQCCNQSACLTNISNQPSNKNLSGIKKAQVQ